MVCDKLRFFCTKPFARGFFYRATINILQNIFDCPNNLSLRSFAFLVMQVFLNNKKTKQKKELNSKKSETGTGRTYYILISAYLNLKIFIKFCCCDFGYHERHAQIILCKKISMNNYEGWGRREEGGKGGKID